MSGHSCCQWARAGSHDESARPATAPCGRHRQRQGAACDARRNRARILTAAAEVFAEQGTSASTEEVARRAGVAIGTVFRHFPAKDDLLRAIMKDLLQQLTGQVELLAVEGDPATALFGFFTSTVEQAAAKKTVIDLLAATGTDVQVTAAIQALQHGIGTLLARARREAQPARTSRPPRSWPSSPAPAKARSTAAGTDTSSTGHSPSSSMDSVPPRPLSNPAAQDHSSIGAVLAEQHDEWTEGRRLGLDILAH